MEDLLMMCILLTVLLLMVPIVAAAQSAPSVEPVPPTAPQIMMDAPAVPSYPEPPWKDSPPSVLVASIREPVEPWSPVGESAAAAVPRSTPAYVPPLPSQPAAMSFYAPINTPFLPEPFILIEPVRLSWTIEAVQGLQDRLITMGLLPQFVTPDKIRAALDAAAEKVSDEIESEGEVTEKRVLSILDQALSQKEKLSKGASAILAVLLLERLKQMVCGTEPIATCFRPDQ